MASEKTSVKVAPKKEQESHVQFPLVMFRPMRQRKG